MDYVRKIDPKAFVTVYSVSDMRYQPKVYWYVYGELNEQMLPDDAIRFLTSL